MPREHRSHRDMPLVEQEVLLALGTVNVATNGGVYKGGTWEVRFPGPLVYTVDCPDRRHGNDALKFSRLSFAGDVVNKALVTLFASFVRV